VGHDKAGVQRLNVLERDGGLRRCCSSEQCDAAGGSDGAGHSFRSISFDSSDGWPSFAIILVEALSDRSRDGMRLIGEMT